MRTTLLALHRFTLNGALMRQSLGALVERLERHVERLYHSAKAIWLDIPMRQAEMVAVVRQTVARSGLQDAYIRLVVTRGKGDLGLDPRKCPRPSVICIVDRIVLWPLGGIAYVSPPPRPGPVLWSIVAGPLVNVILAPILLGACFYLGTVTASFKELPDVQKYLGFYTFLPVEEIERVMAEHSANPGARGAQRVLAENVTRIVHGDDALVQAQAATQALFSGEVATLSKASLEEVFASAPSAAFPKSRLADEGAALVDLLVEASVAKSKREARDFLEQGAISVNGERVGLDGRLTARSLLHGEVVLLRRGRKSWHVLRFRE